MTENEVRAHRQRASEMLARAGIVATPEEQANMEIADFGLGEFERTGLAIIVYVNNERYCGKELIMYPGMTCPEHRHPDVAEGPGKMETFRCRWGEMYLYVPGPGDANAIRATRPEGSEAHYSVFHEIVLYPGDQHTIGPDTPHWFQAGPEGAVVSEFSSTSRDASDVFTDPRIQRLPGY